MTEEQIAAMVRLLKAVADESRLRILGLLANEERSVDELSELLGLRGPTVSHHLARLREAGLVRMRAEGNTHHYALELGRLQSLGEQLFAPGALATVPEETAGDRWEQKVRSAYLDGERLQIPASRKKREVILRWLADRFEPGRRYPEPQVNEIIGRHHADWATLRRELVGAGLMRREAGVYWRPADGAAI